MPRQRVSYAGAVFAILALATVATFAWSQDQKRQPLVLDRVTFGKKGNSAFTPNGDCLRDVVRIRFRMTRSDRANVQIIKPGGRLVRTLARDRFLKRYRYFTFYWNGRNRFGELAPPGRYKLRVWMLGEDRILVPGGAIHLHKVPPNPRGECPPPTGARGE